MTSAPVLSAAAAPEILGTPEFLNKYSDNLKALVTRDLLPEVWPEKSYQYSEIRRNELYRKEKQYLALVHSSTGTVDYKPIDNSLQKTATSRHLNIFDYVLNIYKGDQDKLIAVIGQRSPNVKALPDVQTDDSLVRRARTADRVLSYLRSVWEVDAAQRFIALSLANTSTTFFYTPYVVDADRYGTRTEPRVEIDEQEIPGRYVCPECGAESAVDACPECAAPLSPLNYREPEMVPHIRVVDSEPVPNGGVDLYVCNAYTVTTPFYSRNLADAPWLKYEYECSKGLILRTYRDPERYASLHQIRESQSSTGGIGDSGFSGEQGKHSRDVAASISGVPNALVKNRWVYSRVWVKSYVYEYLADAELRTTLYRQYPRGLKMTFVEDQLIDIEHEAITDVWSAAKPSVSEFIWAPPVFNSFIPIQDWLNDFVNLLREAMNRINPLTFFDPRVVDPETLRDRAPYPGEFCPTALSGLDLSRAFFRAPAAEVKPEIMNILQTWIGIGREITGVLPPIFGGGPATQTARDAEMRRSQALMQLNTLWNEIKDGWRAAYRNGAQEAARYSNGRLFYPDGSGQMVDIPDIHELLNGGWHCEAEETIPMTAAQRRDWMMNMLEAPQVGQQLGAEHPVNRAALREVLPQGWKIPGADMYDRILDTIHTMLEAGRTGQPPPADVDDFLYEPQDVVAVVREWAWGPQGMEAEKENPDGFRYVLDIGRRFMQRLQPPPMPGGPGGEQGGESPPESAPPGPQSPAPGLEQPPPGPPPPTQEPPELSAPPPQAA